MYDKQYTYPIVDLGMRFLYNNTMNRYDLNRRSPEEIKAQFEDEARRLHNELAEIDGKKALVLIVDDDVFKSEALKTAFQISEGVGFIISSHANGEDSINLYQAFRETDPSDSATPVIAVMDSQLAKPGEELAYKTGLEVVAKIAEISRDNGWAMPLIVGASSDPVRNLTLAQAFSAEYIGNAYPPSVMRQAIQERLV